MPATKRDRQPEEKSFQVVLLKFVHLEDFTLKDGTVPDVLPDYSKTNEDVVCSGTVDILTNANEDTIRKNIQEVLVSRVKDLAIRDFDFVKVSGKNISTPALKPDQDFGYKQMRSLVGQGSIYVRLNKPLTCSSNKALVTQDIAAYVKKEVIDVPSEDITKVDLTSEMPIDVNNDVIDESTNFSAVQLVVEDDRRILNYLSKMFPAHSEDYLKQVVQDTFELQDAVETILGDPGKGKGKSNSN